MQATNQGKPGEYAFEEEPANRNIFRVMLAAWRLMGDLQRTDEAGIVELAFMRSRWLRKFSKLEQTVETLRRTDPQIDRAIRERKSLGWINVEALSALPEGTLGWSLAAHVTRTGINPNLVDIEVVDDVSWVLAHLYSTHDIWHVVTGCGTDESGEAGIIGFYQAQIGGTMGGLMLAIALLNSTFFKPETLRPRIEGLSLGYLAGRDAKPLFGVDWNELWEMPLAEVRRNFELDPAPAYPGEGIRLAS